MIDVYLSYPIEFGNLEETKARNQTLIEGLGKRNISADKIFNPLDNDFLTLPRWGIKSVEEFNQLKGNNFPRYKKIIQAFIDADLKKVLQCSFMIVYLDEGARGGVVGEVTFARYNFKPVFAIVPDKSKVSGWTLGCASVIVSSIEELWPHVDNYLAEQRIQMIVE